MPSGLQLVYFEALVATSKYKKDKGLPVTRSFQLHDIHQLSSEIWPIRQRLPIVTLALAERRCCPYAPTARQRKHERLRCCTVGRPCNGWHSTIQRVGDRVRVRVRVRFRFRVRVTRVVKRDPVCRHGKRELTCGGCWLWRGLKKEVLDLGAVSHTPQTRKLFAKNLHGTVMQVEETMGTEATHPFHLVT